MRNKFRESNQILLWLNKTNHFSNTRMLMSAFLNISFTKILKLVSAIFYQIYIFLQNDSLLKTMKNVFYLIQKALFVLEIFSFL